MDTKLRPETLDPDQRAFLLKEYEHWAQSLLQNEEAGERRLNFFVTIVAGAFAAIGFLVKDGISALGATKLHQVAGFAAIVLFALGVLTLARLMKRNASTDLYISQLKKLRRILLTEEWAQFVAADLKVEPRPRPITNGGLAHMAAIINAALIALLVWALFQSGLAPVTIAGHANWWSLAGFCAATSGQLLLIRRGSFKP